MGILGRLLLGTGSLRPSLRAELESEGLVLLEEGIGGSVHYERFKAPGRRHYGKVRLERLALGISKERVVVYCRSGRGRLINTPFSDPRLSALDVSLEDDETVSLRIDFDRAGVPKVSGIIKINAKTPNAPQIVEQLRARLGR